MKESEIIEGNKLIAKFMGYRPVTNFAGTGYKLLSPKNLPIGYLCTEKEECWKSLNVQYHTSWDWLMPIVEKIESLGYFTLVATSDIGEKYYMNIVTGVGIKNETIENPSKFMKTSNIKLECVYKTVVEFINWYNENNIK